MEINETWERYIKDNGANFVHFVDAAALPENAAEGYTCAVLFGKVLSKEYFRALKAGETPKRQEFGPAERKMDSLADKLAKQLEAEGYKSLARLKSGALPHKTVALRAGLGFIGKNNLLITDSYGCALALGKVLTTAPFAAVGYPPREPQCGDCTVCVDICPTNALYGKTWSVTTDRSEILNRKQCTCCLKCMVWCPYTAKYAE